LLKQIEEVFEANKHRYGSAQKRLGENESPSLDFTSIRIEAVSTAAMR
jgi:hypothetical protein